MNRSINPTANCGGATTRAQASRYRRTSRLSALLAICVGSIIPSQALPVAPAQARIQLPPTLTLSVDARYRLVGESAMLTASYSDNVGANHVTEIFDLTTGHRVCAAHASSCSTNVSQANPTTHAYIAYVASLSKTTPPPNVVAKSSKEKVTWRQALVLNGPHSPLVTGGGTTTLTLTASADGDVGPTPYFIEIYDVATGNRLANCKSGKTCSGQATVNSGTFTYAAYIASSSATNPPPHIQAKSNKCSVIFHGIK